VSRDQALAQARADFQTATNSGIRYDPAAFNTFSQEAETALRANNWNPLSNRQAAVDDALALVQRYQGQPRTIDELHALRQDLGDLHRTAPRTASRLIGVIEDRLDDFITTPANAATTAGNVAEGQQALMSGISGYARWAKSEDILRAVDRASQGGNFSSALKNEFSKISNSPNRIRYFNPEERAAIANIAEGGANSTALQFLGALGPSNISKASMV
jgi:peroxiredoxin family protein